MTVCVYGLEGSTDDIFSLLPAGEMASFCMSCIVLVALPVIVAADISVKEDGVEEYGDMDRRGRLLCN